jgi:hypothetical protein
MTDIDQLKKAFQQAISTAATVTPSNEPLTRRDAVQSGQVFSTPVVQGGLGSWAASSGFPLASTTPAGVQLGAVAPSRNAFEMKPGLPGIPDVDFVPYNWNTNRFGGKGGALLGHPISWEVVGPTLKSPYCDWQWSINTAGANDVLTLEAGPNPLLALPTVAQAYNFSPTFDAEGGLYVLFTFTGEGFDGSLAAPRQAITSINYRSVYELYRVASIAGQDITLRSEKRVIDFFSTPPSPACRAITLIRPKVTRLAALAAPINGQVQANRIFVFMPPEESATSEYNPPFDDGVSGSGTWLGGGFDVSGTLPAGLSADYGGKNPLPIPRPVSETTGTVNTVAAGDPSKWVVNVASVPSPLPPVVRVYGIERATAATLSNGSDENCLGYFYVTASTPTSLTLRRVPEVDPDTGAVFWGNGPFYAGIGTVDVRVQFFESVSSLFADSALDFQKLAAARISNLIDPRTVGPSVAYRDTTGVNQVPASKPDRAIFDTVPGHNPGNLLDLGFRAVYFPAKVDPLLGADAVPDFDNPIDSEDVRLTVGQPVREFIETDYSAGVAYLSTTPDAGDPLCQVAPSFPPFFAPNNPRQEIVLFAACVPYSMEEGQTGNGIRVTASSIDSISSGFGENDLADVYGRRVIFRPDVDQVLTPGPGASLTTTLTSLSDIPPSGFFFLVTRALGGLANRRGPYYYQSTSLTVGPPSVVSLDGISGPAGATSVNRTGFTPDLIVLQRTLNPGLVADSADTVKGASKRISTLSFKGADVTFGSDGSVSVEPRTTLQKAYEAGRTVSLSSTFGGPISLSSIENVNFGAILEIFRNPSAPTDGAGVYVFMGANTIASGYRVNLDPAATGPGVSVDQNGAGDGVRVTKPGAGFALNVVGPAAISTFNVSGSGTTNITDGTNLSTITPTAISVTDGVDVSTVSSASVRSDDFLYSLPSPSRTITLSFVGQMAAYGVNWSRGGASDQTARYLLSSSINATTVLDLNQILPEGCLVTDIQLRVVTQAPLSGVGTLCELNYVPVTFGAVPQAVVTVASAATPVAGTQTLSLAASLGAGHTISKASRDYFLLVKNNVDNPGDEIHGIQVTFNDPGPRNY